MDFNKINLQCKDAEKLLHQINLAEIISFDFFDTLFVRPLVNPEDVFEILGKLHRISNFPAIRKQAQQRAFEKMHLEKRKEISLQDIYECLNIPGHSSIELMQAEYDLELDLVEPSKEIWELFLKLLQANNKKVVITSDMYLPGKFFTDALHRNGVENKIPLFISSDCNATKRDSGELFALLAKTLDRKEDKILHIGDNQVSDIDMAQKHGLQTFHYKNSIPKPKKNLTLISSIALGLQHNHLPELNDRPFRKLGFLYAGPANYAFWKWVQQETETDQIDHLLFLSRDGYIMSKMAKAEGSNGEIKKTYFWGSRVAFTLAAIDERNFCEHIPFLLSGAGRLQPRELLERIGVTPPAEHIMESLGLGKNTFVSSETQEQLLSFLYAFRGEILKICRTTRHALFNYLKSLNIKTGERIGIVDVGWSGTTQSAFEMAIKPFLDINVIGYYFCLAETSARIEREKKQKMKAIISSLTTRAELIESMYKHRALIELLFSAPHNTVIGLKWNNKDGLHPVTDVGRNTSQEIIGYLSEITNGALDFMYQYEKIPDKIKALISTEELSDVIFELIQNLPQDIKNRATTIKNFDAWGSSRNLIQRYQHYVNNGTN